MACASGQCKVASGPLERAGSPAEITIALAEIRAFGAGQYQVARRMRALLDDLIAIVPATQRAALERQRALLTDAVTSAIAEDQRAAALVPDRQGIGMAGR
jgi:uncharacterized membrane protein